MTAKTDSPPHRLVSKQNAQSYLVLVLALAITIDGFVIRDVRPINSFLEPCPTLPAGRLSARAGPARGLCGR